MRTFEGSEILQSPLKQVQQYWSPAADPIQRWAVTIGLAIAVGIAYFLAARLSYLLILPDGLAVFWPAAGVSSGVMIALGRPARLPVVVGTMAATIVVNLMGDRTFLGAIGFALSNAGEALLTAWLIEHYFGSDFSLDKVGHVLGLVAAAIVGAAASGVGAGLSYMRVDSSLAPILTTWQHWFRHDALGIVTGAPLVIGLASAFRKPPPQSEVIEGTAALAAVAAMTGIVIALPPEPWDTLVPVTLLFPLLLWIAARCQPVFASVAAFIVSLIIVWAITFRLGHFGNPDLTMEARILSAQASIVGLALWALVLAALFAERRENEARLTQSNMMVERERDNKLLNAQAITATIAHEVRQPLTAIATNASAALRFLGRVPPDHEEVRAALNRIIGDSHRTSELFDGIRALFGKVSQERRQPIDMNEIVLGVLQSLREELKDHRVVTRPDLTSELPLVGGHRGQLREVILNLVHNALEAMDSTTNRSRVLEVRTELRGHDAIVVSVQDSGPGIDPRRLDGIFGAFITTKAHGTGLGLAICRMIAEHHGGQLTASSDGYSGALFQFVLPIEFADKGTASPEGGH
jgi:signal transduction histidine kinase